MSRAARTCVGQHGYYGSLIRFGESENLANVTTRSMDCKIPVGPIDRLNNARRVFIFEYGVVMAVQIMVVEDLRDKQQSVLRRGCESGAIQCLCTRGGLGDEAGVVGSHVDQTGKSTQYIQEGVGARILYMGSLRQGDPPHRAISVEVVSP
jgi:hypothetical protein